MDCRRSHSGRPILSLGLSGSLGLPRWNRCDIAELCSASRCPVLPASAPALPISAMPSGVCGQLLPSSDAGPCFTVGLYNLRITSDNWGTASKPRWKMDSLRDDIEGVRWGRKRSSGHLGFPGCCADAVFLPAARGFHSRVVESAVGLIFQGALQRFSTRQRGARNHAVRRHLDSWRDSHRLAGDGPARRVGQAGARPASKGLCKLCSGVVRWRGNDAE
jgi:hypothetical protein